MSTEIRCFSPVLEEFCRRLGPASWAVVAVSEIAALALWPLAGRAQSVTATVNTGSVPAAANKIYVANGLSNNVTVIDGVTNGTTTVTAGNIPFAVAVNPVTNKIYVANEGGPVTVIDGATNATTSIATGGTPVAVAVNVVTNKIYVANYNSNNVTVIDGTTSATTTVATGNLARAVAINPVTNKIYVANQGDSINPSTVTVIDGATNATVAVNAGTSPFALAVNPVTNTIYVANAGSNDITVINGFTNVTTTVTDTNAGSPDGIAVNPITDKIYVANERSSNVTVIDGATNATATVTVGFQPDAVAANPVTNRIYVVNSNSNNVTVIDGDINTTTTVTVDTCPQALAVNPVTNKIYVANTGALANSFTGTTVTVIDGATNSTTTVTADSGPFAVAVNPVTNKIYVANRGDGISPSTVTVIDGATNATTTVGVGVNPFDLTVNPVTNKIYVANSNGNNLTVIDGATNTTTTVTVGIFPQAVAVNPLTNKIYVANRGDGLNPSTVTVIDGATNSTATVAAGIFPFAVAVNPVTNKIYVANSRDRFNPSTVTVIDGATNSTTTVAAGNLPHAVAVNAATNKIYVANQFSNNVTVIDGATNTTTTVTVDTLPVAMAVNAVKKKTYVANFGGNNVTVLSEEQVQPSPLTTAITPLPGNTTTSAAQAFQFMASNSAAEPVTNLYFQFDTFQGPWSQGTASGAPVSFTGAASGLAVGTHILYAFTVDGEEATSVMQASSPVIGDITAYLFEELGISTSTTFAADVNPASFGSTVTFTAAVTTNPSGSTTPGGSLSFFDGSTFLGNVALDNTGHAALQTNLLTVGGHSITAFYVPSTSAGFAASTSTTLDETVNQAASSTALTSSPNPASFAQSVTFAATVSSSTTGTPTGVVQFLDTSTLLGTGTLGANGQVTFGTSSLALGTHSITAKYSGDPNFAGSASAAVSETVNTAATSTGLTSSANPAPFRQSVTFTASVSPNIGSGVPTGALMFFDGTTQIATATLDAAAQATFSTSSLAPGNHWITANYPGDPSFAASTSAALSQTINPLDFSIGAAAGGSTSATVKAGQTATYALQLSLVGGAVPDQLMVTVSCTGAPSKATCTGSPSPVTATTTGPAALAISVSTTANGLLIPIPPSPLLRNPVNRLPILLVLAVLVVLCMLRKKAKARTGRSAWAAKLTFAASVLLLAMTIAAIGGCGSTTQTPPPVNNGTPLGTYTLTVTAASGNLTHIQKLTLTVQ